MFLHRAFIVGLLLLSLVCSASAQTPLTTPRATTATQYLVRSVVFHFDAQMVTIRVELKDSAGTTLQIVDTQPSFSQARITAAQQAAVIGWITTYLKSTGVIN